MIWDISYVWKRKMGIKRTFQKDEQSLILFVIGDRRIHK